MCACACARADAFYDGALFLQSVKHRWPWPEHIMAKWAGPSNAENDANTNPNPNLNPNIYAATLTGCRNIQRDQLAGDLLVSK